MDNLYENKLYRFKNVKHSVKMRFLHLTRFESKILAVMENADYKGLLYQVDINELEEVSDDRD